MSEALKTLVTAMESGRFADQKAEIFSAALSEMLLAETPDPLITTYLQKLAAFPVTAPCLSGSVQGLRKQLQPIPGISAAVAENLIDTCGTGGDGLKTINISTTSALLAASAGAKIAKHGNRSASSRSGSADVLEALGISLELNPEKSLSQTNFAFLFAPRFYPAMKRVAQIRKKIGGPTIFNLIGPLANPVQAGFQMVGVYREELLQPFADALVSLGIRRAWVCHGESGLGEPGLDEISNCGKTRIAEVSQGQVRMFTIDVSDIGMKKASIQDLSGGDAKENAGITEEILSGQNSGPKADVACLNAAAALQICGRVETLQDGLLQVKDAIRSGAATEVLNRLRALK